MTASPHKPKLIMDACVLIDCIDSDQSIFGLIKNSFGPICVINEIVKEVKSIESTEQLIPLGLILVEPELEDCLDAHTVNKATSFNDNLCFLTAKRNGYICVTNDKSLKKLCAKHNVRSMWGLELITKLHDRGCISTDEALKLGEKIKTNNFQITSETMEDFRQQVLLNNKKRAEL